MKNKNIVIIIALVCLIILASGGFFVLSSKKTSTIPAPTIEPQSIEEVVTTLSAEDIGLNLKTAQGNQKVIMEILNTNDISSLDYELSYASKGDIPRGAIGHLDVKTKGQPVRQEIVLGTCSDVCHYDQEVSNIKLTLKVNKTDGNVYSVEKSL